MEENNWSNKKVKIDKRSFFSGVCFGIAIGIGVQIAISSLFY